jgi:sarcosine oxidase
MTFDVIVVGVGGHGSAAAYHLARRGMKVLALERFSIPHVMGSSHGYNRLLRVAYAEGATYVPLAQRARELWQALSMDSGDEVFLPTGSLDIGYADRLSVPKALASCKIHGLDHDVLDAGALRRRHPAWRPDADHIALWQPDGGLVRTERSILAHVRLALRHGAEVRALEPVSAIAAISGGGVRVTTPRTTYEAGRAVVTAGAWVGKLIPELAGVVEVRRIPVAWFATRAPEIFAPDRFPVWTLDCSLGEFYGVPIDGHAGVKLGGPSSGDQPGRWRCDPDTIDRTPTDADWSPLAAVLSRHLPDAAGPPLAVQSGLITWTPDGNFAIDQVPSLPNVLAVSACSGHGFKFASLIGEIAADLAIDGGSRHDLSRFRLDRFLAAT